MRYTTYTLYMKKFKNIIGFVFCLALILSCSEDGGLVPIANLEAIAIDNVSYGEDPDQVFDIYLPADRTFVTKVMIIIHGGGWRAGDKQDLDGYKEFIIEQSPDLAVVNLNYRLADDDTPPLPMQTDDITSVINHLKENQQEYQIGTDLGFLGASAGAHLSLLWSYVHDTEEQVKMVCSIVGPTNLADQAYLNSDNQDLKDLFFQFGETIEELEEVSPLHRVTATSPPTILFYGAKDPLIPNSQGLDLKDRLEELGVVHEFTLYPDAGHGWSGDDLFDTAIKLKAFIETHLVN